MSNTSDPFVVFTRCTDYPKLGWLIEQLENAAIACEIRGESWHAPILYVQEEDLDAAWRILDPVDDIPDDDDMFGGFWNRVPETPDTTPIAEA